MAQDDLVAGVGGGGQEWAESASWTKAGTARAGISKDNGLYLGSFTTTQRDALSSVTAGTVIFNSTLIRQLTLVG